MSVHGILPACTVPPDTWHMTNITLVSLNADHTLVEGSKTSVLHHTVCTNSRVLVVPSLPPITLPHWRWHHFLLWIITEPQSVTTKSFVDQFSSAKIALFATQLPQSEHPHHKLVALHLHYTWTCLTLHSHDVSNHIRNNEGGFSVWQLLLYWTVWSSLHEKTLVARWTATVLPHPK